MSDFHLPELNKIDIRRQSQIWLADWQNQRQLRRLAREVADHTPDPGDQHPVVFFRASTGLLHMSQNTAFPLLVSWATRLAGTPVVHFSCQAGMSLCVQ